MEHDDRRLLRQVLKPYHPVPVENGMAHPGTPDLNCTLGWVELKRLDRWPARDTTIVRHKRFTKQQRRFLLDRWLAGGGAWLLLRVGPDWLLFTGHVAAKHFGYVPKHTLYLLACGYWFRKLHGEELVECLQRSRDAF